MVIKLSKSIRAILIGAILMVGFIALSSFFKGTIRANPIQGTGKASFNSGVIHGALMPLALVPIIANQDIPIYEVYNTGRWYHIGYILGVNICGFIFIPPMAQSIKKIFNFAYRRNKQNK